MVELFGAENDLESSEDEAEYAKRIQKKTKWLDEASTMTSNKKVKLQ